MTKVKIIPPREIGIEFVDLLTKNIYQLVSREDYTYFAFWLQEHGCEKLDVINKHIEKYKNNPDVAPIIKHAIAMLKQTLEMENHISLKKDIVVDNINFVYRAICERLDEDKEVDWTKIAVDTKVLVRDTEKSEWQKRYFTKYENNKIYTFPSGNTSWSIDDTNNIIGWKYAKLASQK